MYLTHTNKNIEIYFKEIRSYGNLTREDEINLFTRIAKGDKSAEAEVFNKMSKLAVATAKLYGGNPELLEDLIQEANMGVLAAISKYDSALGYRFSSYAIYWMKAYITVFLNDMGIVHPASPVVIDKARKIREEFFRTYHREISEYELLDLLEKDGVVVKDVKSITSIFVSSIDRTIDDDDDVTASDYGEFAEKTSSRNAYEEEVEADYLKHKVESLMGVLDSREKELVKIYFGIDRPDAAPNFESVADVWNKDKEQFILRDGILKKNPAYLTSERCRQIIIGAINKMK